MKTNLKKKGAMLLGAAGAMLLLGCTSCKKTDEPVMTPEQKTAMSDMSSGVSVCNDAVAMVDEAVLTGQVNTFSAPSGCASVQLDTATQTVSIDFGSTSCLCLDGRYRSGTVTATWAGSYQSSGSTADITFTNYYVDSIYVNGSVHVVYNGQDGQGNESSSITWNGTLSKTYNQDYSQWYNAQITRTQTAGATTPALADDLYAITGAVDSVITNHGIKYIITIPPASPLIRDYSCKPYLVQGIADIIQYTYEEDKPLTGNIDESLPNLYSLDWGAGACDSLITVTWTVHSSAVVVTEEIGVRW